METYEMFIDHLLSNMLDQVTANEDGRIGR